MSRLNQIDDLLFPVEEHPVYAYVPNKSAENWLPVPTKKAIVNKETNQVLGVVSKEYRLVTNHEALEWAFQCCQIAFPETKRSEWEVKATDAPESGGHCFIDLVHNSVSLDFEFVPANDKPDAFGPFIRLTNSYNSLRALSFDIGFFRKVCKNGLILPESIIRFKYSHLRRNIGKEINFDVEHKRLKKLRASFLDYLGVLRDFAVSTHEFEPLFYGVLKINEPKNRGQSASVANDWESLSKHISALCSAYKEDLGENAYAVFNAITEFASHPPQNLCVHRERHSFQKLAGEWISGFSRECRKPGFSISEYVERFTESKEKQRTF